MCYEVMLTTDRTYKPTCCQQKHVVHENCLRKSLCAGYGQCPLCNGQTGLSRTQEELEQYGEARAERAHQAARDYQATELAAAMDVDQTVAAGNVPTGMMTLEEQVAAMTLAASQPVWGPPNPARPRPSNAGFYTNDRGQRIPLTPPMQAPGPSSGGRIPGTPLSVRAPSSFHDGDFDTNSQPASVSGPAHMNHPDAFTPPGTPIPGPVTPPIPGPVAPPELLARAADPRTWRGVWRGSE